MQYTVKEVAELTGVTVKTLHHYHKIGLLEPSEISHAGYRIYEEKELQRLQQILFYRELDFSLKDIKKALEDEPNRLLNLKNQYEMLKARSTRLNTILKTLDASIASIEEGKFMDKSEMFKGLNKEEWENALSEQNQYLKDKYNHDLLKDKEIIPEELNEKAQEAKEFLENISDALISRWNISDERLQKIIENHLSFLNKHGISIDANSFLKQTKFFMEDDFHRNMLESQQVGLCYYLSAAAEAYASIK